MAAQLFRHVQLFGERRSYTPIKPPLPVAAWISGDQHFVFGIPQGWRSMTADEAAAQGAGRAEVFGGALSEPTDAQCAVMAASFVSMGDMSDGIRSPRKLIAKRKPGDARLIAGPERWRVAEGRALQIRFEETVPGESYGSESPTLQGRVETIFEGMNMVWIFQLIAPAQTLASYLGAYQTALGTWRWT
jgi:hypothetical protein